MLYEAKQPLADFPAWGKAREVLDLLIKNEDVHATEIFIDEEVFGDKIPTDEEVNTYLAENRDEIANDLGYSDWDSYERYCNWEEGDEVFWYDPATADYESEEAYEEACKTVWVIEDIDKENETAWIFVKELGGPAQTEVYLSELELVKDKK